MEIDPKIIELLKKRGIKTKEELNEFFSEKPRETYDPFLLPDMEAGVDLILSAIEDDKKICIYGDYDCDGVTSTVILTEILSKLTKKVMQYIPSRFDEGYGLNKKAIETIKEKGAGLIVTVDCGSVSVEEVEYAKELGVDIMVTDHHEIADKQANCILINPARRDSEYPFRYLAGCGVAFKLTQAIADTAGIDRSVVTSLLDLVAVGTIGDIVPLVSENRTLAKYGIRMINTSRRLPLKALIEVTGLKPGSITAENISYVIVPHINAAGRMQSAGLALRLFLSKEESEMLKYADDLSHVNAERKTLQNEVFERACHVVDDGKAGKDFIVAYLKDAHEGVAGIAAGKLKEKYHVPAVIVTDTEEGMLKGTGRSPSGVDLYTLLKREEKWFSAFGGHAAACGFTMKKEGLSEMMADLDGLAKKLREEDPGSFEESSDAEISLLPDEANVDFVSQLALLEPCGCANERPLIEVTGKPVNLSSMGKDGKYRRFSISGSANRIGCVVFRDAEAIEKAVEHAVEKGKDISVIGELVRHEWNGAVSAQINVRAVR